MAKPSGIGNGEMDRCARGAADVISTAVAAAFTVPVSELRQRSRRRATVALARQTAMYLAHVTSGLNFAEVGRVFGRDRTTAAYACRRIEDRRTDVRLDMALAELEQVLRRNVASRIGARS